MSHDIQVKSGQCETEIHYPEIVYVTSFSHFIKCCIDSFSVDAKDIYLQTKSETSHVCDDQYGN